MFSWVESVFVKVWKWDKDWYNDKIGIIVCTEKGAGTGMTGIFKT